MALTLSALRLEKEARLAANSANRPFAAEDDRSRESSLESLRRYREKDPEFKLAIASFVDAEASLEDPLEGSVRIEAARKAEAIETVGTLKQFQAKKMSPARTKIRGMKGA